MKKIAIAAVILAVMMLTGCEGDTQPVVQTQTPQKPKDITVSSLPYPEFTYNGKPFHITDIALYQSYNDERFIYNPYLIVKFDISALTDEDLHYLGSGDIGQMRGAYLDVTPWYYSKSNNLAVESMPQIAKYRDGAEIVFCFYDYSQSFATKSLEDMEVHLDISITQADNNIVTMYSQEERELEEKCTIMINGSSDIKIEVLPESEVPETESKMLSKGFQEIMKRGY